MSKTRCWEALFGAIILEVIGSTIMKLSQEWNFYGGAVSGLITMWAAVGFSYYLLAVSTTRIPVGVAYAFWEGFGLALITLSSYFVLHESLDMKRLLGLLSVLLGAWLVHKGTSPKKKNAKS